MRKLVRLLKQIVLEMSDGIVQTLYIMSVPRCKQIRPDEQKSRYKMEPNVSQQLTPYYKVKCTL